MSTTMPATLPGFAAGQGIRLAIDFGTVTTRALLCWPGGQRQPLLTDQGGMHWPTTLASTGNHTLVAGPEALALADSDPHGPDALLHDLKSQLTRDQLHVDGHAVAPAAALAALLARLANQAHRVSGLPVSGLAVTVPAGWGPRHRAALRDAADRAGLPPPLPVPVPVAAGWTLTTSDAPPPAGSMLLVCDAGHAAFEATLLVRTTSGYSTLATARRPDAGGAALDALLTEHCLTQLSTLDPDLAARLRQPASPTDHRDRRDLDQHVHTARTALTNTQASAAPTDPGPAQTVSVAVPAPYPPIPIGNDRWQQLAGPVARHCAQIAHGVLDAGEAHPGDMTRVMCVGGAATAQLYEALRQRGLAPCPVARPDLIALYGAADAPEPGQPPQRQPRSSPGRWHPVPLVTAVIAGGSAGVLAFHAVYSATVDGFYHNIPTINWGEYAMASCCALLAATAAAETPTRPPAPTLPGLNLPRAPRLAYAALAGLLAALALALTGVTRLALPWSLGSFLAWAILPITPIAALAVAVGILTHHDSRHDPHHAHHLEPTGRRRVVPAEGVAVAAAGMIALQIPLMGAEHPQIWYALLNLTDPDTAKTIETVSGHLGAAAIAAGTALTAAASLRARLIAVPTVALAGLLIQPFGLTTALGLAFTAAATFWWTLRTIRLLIGLAPQWRHPADTERRTSQATTAPGPHLDPGPNSSNPPAQIGEHHADPHH